MRQIVAIGMVVALAFAPSAVAQTAGVRIGPYRLGMAVEEASAPDLRKEFGRQFSLDLAYNVDLSFVGGRLDRIAIEGTAGGPVPATCFAEFFELVTALEVSSGPLNGEPQPGEGSGIALAPERTPGGSEIRKFHNEESGAYGGVARTSGVGHVIARALIVPGERNSYTCLLTVVASDASNERPPGLPPAPTVEDLAAAQLLERPRWLQRPDARVIAAWYPSVARDQGIEGQVELDCLIEDGGTLRCAIATENPGGYGFGRAALVLASMLRIAGHIDGVVTQGRRIRQRMSFALPR